MTTATKKTVTNDISIGSPAPAFSMPADTGKTVSLADFAGTKNVVLYFYPKDDTPGCTIEAKDFRDLAADFTKAGAVVIGVSKDSLARHEKFKTKYDLNFILASDETTKTCEDYGVWVEKNMYGKKYMGIARATFLIGKDGNIAQIWPKVKIEGHAAEVLAEAKKLGA